MAFAVLLLILVAAAVVLIPWQHPPTPSRSAQLAALAEIPASAVAKGKEFAAATRPGGYLSMAAGLIAALVLGLTPLGARLVAACGRPFGGHWLAEAALGGLAVLLAAQLVTLPFTAWRHTVLVRYGLSTQNWGGWAADLAKSYAITIVFGLVALIAFYGLTRLAPRLWWVFAATGAALLVVLMSLIYPVLVEPVFNKFESMPAGELRTELLDLAARDGVPVKDVLVADASRRTRAVNAYVSGIGPTRRIVVYDTLLHEAPDDEVVMVVAHELGHAKNNDVVIGTALGAIGAAATVCGIAVLGGFPGLLRRAGVDSITSPRAVALLLAVIAVVGLVGTPIQNLVSRRVEAAADEHALVLTGDPGTFASMQQRLATANLGDVDPPAVLFWLFASHPSTVQRIAAARVHADGG
ncbi:M48 family metallopeptidase [Phytomonospora sp. NPDC050363]|uniref:M48 family metallopeptidase n=1 Tax=Phytomonospora sp. NPDC050363 TaxID=3155642 RepID=UPI00340531F2